MKILLYIIGLFVSIFASVKLLQYVFSEKGLTEYGKGFVWGNIVLILAGLILIFFAWKKKKSV